MDAGSGTRGQEPVRTGRSRIASIGRISAAFLISCLLFFVVLSLGNLAVVRWKLAHTPLFGQIYVVNGRQMHISCSGAGKFTVVIEAGAGADSLGWQGIQNQLNAFTRVCTYDRAGHGWSQPRSVPQDAEEIARELHALLGQAGVHAPLVLMGHSAGGLMVREYAREYPAEVAGVVLIESSSPQQIDDLPGWRQGYEANRRAMRQEHFWEAVRVWSGWERLTGNCHNEPSPELKYLTPLYDAKMCRPEYVGGEDAEFPYFEDICKQAGRLTSFGNVPLLVISKDPGKFRHGMTADDLAERPIWDHEQELLKSLSPLSWRVIAKNSGHAVHHDRPEIVVIETEKLIGYLQGTAAPAFGSTRVE